MRHEIATPCRARDDTSLSSHAKVGRITFVLGTLALMVVGFPYGREFLDSDRCVDSGGRWNGSSYDVRNEGGLFV